jgi:hypothetical protein
MDDDGQSDLPRRRSVARVLRWQPESQLQVWLFAIWSGLSLGAIYSLVTYLVHGPASHSWPVDGLAFAGGITVTFGLGQCYRLRRRRDTQMAAQWQE